MDAFENIVAGLLWNEGYWTFIGYKVNLSKEAKVRLGKSSLPRPEIDILAYRAKGNEVLWVECKSYMDSRGVKAEALTDKNDINARHYKVFTWDEYRDEVKSALVEQLLNEGHIDPNPVVKFCLVTGKIATGPDRKKLHIYFEQKGHKDWVLYDEFWVKKGLIRLAEKGYENDIATQVAKLFTRIQE